jgi:hypothetical protein
VERGVEDELTAEFTTDTVGSVAGDQYQTARKENVF